MNTARATKLLFILLLLAAVVCAIGMARLGALRADAIRAQEDLRQVRIDLARMGPTALLGSATKDVNSLLRSAAAQAGLAGALAGIEPGRPGEGGLTPVFIRLDALPLPQIVSFLHRLRGTAGARIDAIELSAADSSAGQERWTATVTVSVRAGR